MTTALSTSPDARAPGAAARRPGPVRTAWRRLTSMRTALVLLFLLAVAAIPGSLLPQQPNDPLRVERWFADHPRLAPLLDLLGAFDVYASPGFLLLYALLAISLVGCLTPRIRLHARALRAEPPAAPAHLHRLAAHASATTGVPADDVVTAAVRTLRRRHWRTSVRTDAQGRVAVSAEKGYLRETGNLVFHLSLLLLLAGIAYGWLFGYKGTVLLVEGDGFTNTRVAYDELDSGRLVQPDDLPQFGVTLTDFRASYLPNGQPSSFEADVRWTPSLDAAERTATLRVNHPLTVAGARVYLMSHGYAPVLVVRDARGNVLRDGPTPFLPQDSSLFSTGVVKVPDVTAGPQLGFRGQLFPSLDLTADGRVVSTHPEARVPGVLLEVFYGDLGLDDGVPQNVYELDTSEMQRQKQELVLPGQTISGLPGGATVTYEGLRQFAVMQVTRDPAKRVVLVAACLIVIGLALSLRVRRRRIWLRTTTGDGSTLVEIGGLARSDPGAFAAEFDRLAESLLRDPPAQTGG